MTEFPRWLDSEQTARYLGVRVDRLPKLVRTGRIQSADYSLGPRTPRWDRNALDAMFEASAAKTATDDAATQARKASRENAEWLIQTGRRTRRPAR
jgi:hypothetical protein